VDPLADQRSWVSPYNYVQNNPINRIDPIGALDEPPVNGLPYFGDDTGDYYWNDELGSYDQHDKKTGDYVGQFELEIDETYEPVGEYRISFFNYTGDESPENNKYDESKTPLAAASTMLYLYQKGGLKSLTEESKYPGVKIYTSPHMEGAVTLGNVIFLEEGFYKKRGASLIKHEYGHFLDYKYHFNYNFTSYGFNVGLPSLGSAGGIGTYGGDHSKNPVERKADILSAAYFRRF